MEVVLSIVALAVAAGVVYVIIRAIAKVINS